MVHANANYAAGAAKVAYDSETLSRPTIERTLRRFGAQTVLSALWPISSSSAD